MLLFVRLSALSSRVSRRIFERSSCLAVMEEVVLDLLRANAIPILFSHTKSANERPASERRKRKACHEEVSAALILIRKNPILSSAK